MRIQITRDFWLYVLGLLIAIISLAPLQANAEGDLKVISSQPYWLKLLHYQTNFLGRSFSKAKGGGFFISPDGANNPYSELLATLASLKADPKPGKRHAQCRFPLRTKWLLIQIPSLQSQLKIVECPILDNWLKKNSPEKISLIYAASFLENPSSAFGHIFLRLDKAGKGLQAPMVQFSAITEEVTGFEYLLNGVFGGFKGYFTLEPQHLLMRSNLELEDRDLWIYDLPYSQSEQENLMLHLWELQGVHFSYFFFKENCGYRLVEFLELAKFEGQDIPKDRLFWSLPTDDLKNILNYNKNQPATNRLASRSKRWKYSYERLNNRQKDWFAQLVEDFNASESSEFVALPNQDKSEIFDALNDYYRIRLNSRLGEFEILDQWLHIKEKQKEIRGVRLKLLKKRSRIKIKPLPNVPLEQGPEASHGAILFKVEKATIPWGSSKLQLAGYHHDLLSSPTGHLSTARFRVFDVTLEQNDNPSVEMKDLTLFEILSLNPRGNILSPISWRMQIGVTQPDIYQNDKAMALETLGQAGGTWQLSSQFYSYILGGLSLQSHTMSNPKGKISPIFLAGAVFRPWQALGFQVKMNRKHYSALFSTQKNEFEIRALIYRDAEINLYIKTYSYSESESGLGFSCRF